MADQLETTTVFHGANWQGDGPCKMALSLVTMCLTALVTRSKLQGEKYMADASPH